MNDRITLIEGFNDRGALSSLIHHGDRSSSNGMLRFGHEFEVGVGPENLNFLWADSIDCGELTSYGAEADFEAAFPGALAELKRARDEGRLFVRVYVWDPLQRRNLPHDVPFGDYSHSHKGGSL